MKLSEAMKNKMLLSFELFPPKTDKGMENLPGTIEHLCKYQPEYISCTYGAGGTNVGKNMDVCKMIQDAGTIRRRNQGTASELPGQRRRSYAGTSR